MFFYDLDLSQWTRKPGSKSPPELTPVLTVGGECDLAVLFCRGRATANPAAASWTSAVKLAGDTDGAALASDSAPTQDGNDTICFLFDLSAVTVTAEQTAAVIQIGFTDIAGAVRRTQPLACILQANYLSEP